jgi:DNA-binding NarL/FixJ family response regulator
MPSTTSSTPASRSSRSSPRPGTAGGPRVGPRIAVVDDHPVVTAGVGAHLDAADDLVLEAVATTVDELLARTSDLDVVLLDLRLADGTTPSTNIARLRATGALVLAYTSGEDAALLREAARGGVVGVVRKSEPLPAVLDAVRAVLRGEVAASADWAAAIDADRDIPSAGLTDREAQVLELYAAGEKADRVARVLGISRETVLDHVRRIRVKYAAVDRAAPTKVELYRRAVEDGVLPG